MYCRSCNKEFKVAKVLTETYVDTKGNFHEKCDCDVVVEWPQE